MAAMAALSKLSDYGEPRRPQCNTKGRSIALEKGIQQKLILESYIVIISFRKLYLAGWRYMMFVDLGPGD